MQKAIKILVMALIMLFCLVFQALALTVTYNGTDTNYSITSVTNGNNVTEEYHAQSLIPYTSQDGNAVVDLNPSTDSVMWFDTVIVLNDKNDLKSNLQITWDIKNTSPFTWSDYHFIFDPGQIIKNTNSNDFKGVTIVGNTEIDYYYGPNGSKLIKPGQTLNLSFSLNTEDLPQNTTINLRQIATASHAPLPPSALLLGSGLLGLGLLGWRRQKN